MKPFPNPQAAIDWGLERGVFRCYVHARNAYQKLKREQQPATAAEMARLWREDVARREEELKETFELHEVFMTG